MLKLRRIYASCIAQNAASGRVLQKIGMRYEGRQQQHICKWGVFHDLDLYGMVNDGESQW